MFQYRSRSTAGRGDHTVSRCRSSAVTCASRSRTARGGFIPASRYTWARSYSVNRSALAIASSTSVDTLISRPCSSHVYQDTPTGVDPAEWAYGYVRISRDDKDGAEGVRLQAKHEVAYAERKGLRLARIFCDNDMSGADPNRPALRELLELVMPGPTKIVLARDVARLTRDYDLGNELMKLGRDEGVRFVFMKDHEYDLTTGVGRKNFTVKVAEATEYREVNTENLLDRMTEEAEKGVMQGGSRRFGYGKVVGTHPITGAEILDRRALRAEEVAVLCEGRDRVINGESQTAIITDWNARGITTSEGWRWRVGKLSQQLLLEAYVIYRAQWPGIFTRTEHEAMRAALIAHRSGKDPQRPRQRNGEYWLTGLAQCGGTWKAGTERAGEYCGGWLVGSLIERKRKHGTVIQRRYGCQAVDSARVRCGCGRVFRDAGALEMFVAQAVIAEYENPEILARLDRGNDHAGRIAALQQRIETTTGNLDAEPDRRTEVLTGARDADDLRVIERTIAGLKQTLKDLRSEQDSLRSTQALAVLADIGSTPAELRKAWDTKGSRWRHEAAARLIEKVIVKPTRVYATRWIDQNGKTWRFDESSVEILWRDLG
ncbi:recombinase family protein [Nocardia sp. AB354]|uniref:recombinase family protein n=1 Tax=Nocardia sp. AB354 TaxID=3413283 RepID=UPI003C291CAD